MGHITAMAGSAEEAEKLVLEALKLTGEHPVPDDPAGPRERK